ncbi:MAG: magnesium transporter [Gammaproteobacteria bacterium]
MSDITTPRISTTRDEIDWLVSAMHRRAPLDAAELLAEHTDDRIVEVLKNLEPTFALKVLARLPRWKRIDIMPKLPKKQLAQWETNLTYNEDCVGRLMTPPIAVFPSGTLVADAKETLRELAQKKHFTYAYCCNDDWQLIGVVVMRDLMFAADDSRLDEIMVADPFAFTPETTVEKAMREVLERHYPVYPVCKKNGKLVGLVRGYALFSEHNEALTATPGKMFGVQHEEHLTTPWMRSLKFRHPWLQINLVTAFLAAIVVGMFEDTIAQVVMLAAVLPVLAGQSGNTGCQALAVTLRGMAMDQFKPGMGRSLLLKEAWLGTLNGLLVGITAAGAIYLVASTRQDPHALLLATVILIAMIGSCIISGVTGVLVPLTLSRVGADPATASNIFLTTATDIVSIGLLLGLATLMIN